MESAEYEIRLRDSFSAGLGRLESRMNKFESKVGGLGQAIAGAFGGFTLATAVSKGVSLIGELATTIVSLGADMEQTQISFETMLGSAEKANKTIKELQDFAKITPFSQKDVIVGAKSLLAYGFEAQNLTKDLTTLGDVSAGLSIPINDLIYLYGTLKTQGKAMSKDLMQFAGRGIPIYKELGKVLGVDTSKVSELVSDGKVGFKEVEKAFHNMTAAGSMFGGLMEKQSQSLAGRWSTFKDTLEIMATNLGTKLVPSLGQMLDKVSSIVALIPELDFSPLVSVFADLWEEIKGVFDIFSQLVDLFGGSLSTFEALSYVIRAIAFNIRTSLLPIRIFITVYSELMALIKNSLGVFKGLGQVLQGIFTGNFKLVNSGAKQMQDSIINTFTQAKQIGDDFVKQEYEGYSKIFSPFGSGPKATDSSTSKSSLSSSGRMTSNAATKDIGVEKVQSGTKSVVVNITKLIDKVVFEKGYKESEAKLQEMLTKAMLTSVNDVNIVSQ